MMHIKQPLSVCGLLPIPVGLLVLPCTRQCRQSPLTPYPFFFLSRTEEPTKADTCARDRRALQELALNVFINVILYIFGSTYML